MTGLSKNTFSSAAIALRSTLLKTVLVRVMPPTEIVKFWPIHSLLFVSERRPSRQPLQLAAQLGNRSIVGA